ncbi:hypothetical protein Scep_019669 [Stephania cephalantha]|uniref:Uncharacterized protein n=1 Tax=Stephania cephalantha TaxID=152367 RepID=A0AAP0NNI9_9MAGN
MRIYRYKSNSPKTIRKTMKKKRKEKNSNMIDQISSMYSKLASQQERHPFN